MPRRMPYTSEAWLRHAWTLLTPLTEAAIGDLPDRYHERCVEPHHVQLSVGYDHEDTKRRLQAVCNYPDGHSDNLTHTIFVSPVLAGRERRLITLLAVLLHEQIHTYVPHDAGGDHGTTFRAIASRLGFKKPFTVVSHKTITPRLRTSLRPLAVMLGNCPWRPIR